MNYLRGALVLAARQALFQSVIWFLAVVKNLVRSRAPSPEALQEPVAVRRAAIAATRKDGLPIKKIVRRVRPVKDNT